MYDISQVDIKVKEAPYSEMPANMASKFFKFVYR